LPQIACAAASRSRDPVTVLFLVCAFLPFLSWVPALLWLLVVGVGLLFVPATRTVDQPSPDRGVSAG
jgi:hypothetical protein